MGCKRKEQVGYKRKRKWGVNAKVRIKRRGQKRNTFAYRSQISRQSSAKALPTWDKKKLLLVGADRGYLTERSVVYGIANCLGLSRNVVSYIMATGRFRWEQILAIGAFFEMSPREFCDVFLHDYFREDELGHYRCYVENVEMLLHPPVINNGKKRSEEVKREEIEAELSAY